MLREPLRVTLDLGDVEIPLEELLKMRPGGSYVFTRPAQFQSTLNINGQPWASALLAVGDDAVTISIQALGPQLVEKRA